MIQTQFNSNEKLWSGIPLPPLYNPKVSLGRVLLRAMELHPTRMGQISANNNVELTYGEMYTKSIRAAQNIQAWNYKKGDVFGIVSTNNHNMMPLIVGLLCLDHPITPIPSVFTEFEMNHMLNMTKPKVVFSDKESYDIVKKCLIQLKNDARIYIFGGSIDEDIFDATGREDEFIPVDVDGDKDIAGILFSSGTSISANNNVEMTYGEMYTKSIRAAQNIQAWNYKKGDVFGIISNNNHHLMPLIVALLCLDHPINPIPTAFTASEVKHMLSMTRPKVVFSDLDSYEMIKKCLIESKNDAQIYTFGGRTGESTAVEDLFAATGRENEFIPVNVDGENDIAVILSSSGTTGPAKAVSLTHAAVLENLAQVYGLNGNDIVFTFNSPSWMAGLAMLLRSILYSSMTVLTTDEFSPNLLLRIIEKYKVTVVLSATFHWLMLLKSGELRNADLSSLKCCNIIGSILPSEASRAINSFLPNGQVIVRYGMTEIGGTVSINYLNTGNDAVGQLVSGCQVKIVGDNGDRLGIGEDGEICIKSTYKFAGYYGDQEGTDALFDAEGFIQTGDLGHFDENGFLFIVGRKKDMLICADNRISPSRIEGALMENSGIKSVCVVGIEDAILDQLPAAVVVRNHSSSITAQEVYDIVASGFRERWKLNGGVYFVDSLPMTTTGKFVRRQVKEIATEMRQQEQLKMDNA